MTGILPVKKYGTHSALNMFDEFSMLEPNWMAPYMGCTARLWNSWPGGVWKSTRAPTSTT